MKIPFVSGAYEDRSPNVNSNVCQNLYPEIDQQEGKEVLSLMGTPGLSAWAHNQGGPSRFSGTLALVNHEEISGGAVFSGNLESSGP